MPGSKCLIGLGIVAYVCLYLFQACVLVYYMAEHFDKWFGFMIIAFLASLLYLLNYKFFRPKEARIKAIRNVWIAWLLYTVALVASIGIIFSTVVEKLDTSDVFGPKALKMVLCITPVLLILLLNVTIPSGNEKFVERLSITTVLDLFDGIEMLEVILLQKENSSFDFPKSLETWIVIFVSINFLLSPMVLFQRKEKGQKIKSRKKTLAIRTFIQVIFVNTAFLVIRCVIWSKYKHDASIFIAKNILSIIISVIECFSEFRLCECGSDTNETYNM